MRRLLFVAMSLLAAVAATASAQRDDRIELFTDAQMSTCGLEDNGFVIQSVYVFHTGSGLATASEFAVPKPACWVGATYLGDQLNPSLLAIGNSQTDLSIAYGGCMGLPLYLGRIDYFTTGTAPACCEYLAQAGSRASPPAILVADCGYEEHVVSGGSGVMINPDADCPCDVAPPPPPPPPTLPPKIEIFADQTMSSCHLTDNGSGIRSIYVFQTGTDKATGAEFSVPKPACWANATYVGESIATPFLAIGNSQTDLSIAYTACLQPPIYIARIDFVMGASPPVCCEYRVEPGSMASPPDILVADCNYIPRSVLEGGSLIINGNSSCPCGQGSSVQVQATTWGRVKAIYRN